MNRNTLSKYFSDKRVLGILSLLLALVAWAVVTFSVNPNKVTEVRAVPIQMTRNEDTYKSMGLDIISAGEKTISVRVSGRRSVIGGLSAADIVVYPQYSQVTGAGEYDLPLVATKANPLQDFEITSISSGTVHVRFDRTSFKALPVEPAMGNVTVPQGYLLQQSLVNPAQITLTGPQKELDLVHKAVAQVNLAGEQKSTTIATAPVKLLDKDGKPVEAALVTANVQQVEVTVPVLKLAKLPVRVEFANVPPGLDTAMLPHALSAQQLQLAAPEAVLAQLPDIRVGPVDLRTFQIGKPYTFEIKLPTGVVSQDGVKEVQCTFSLDALEEKYVAVSNIEIANKPADYEVVPMAARVSGVRLVGPFADIQKITAADLTVKADLAGMQAGEGQRSAPLVITSPKYPSVFAAGSYTLPVVLHKH